MEIKQFVVLCDGEHEYNIFEKENKKGHRVLVLKYSDAEFWNSSIRGKTVLTLTDTGNGIKLSKNIKSLGYDDFAEIRILMNFAKATNSNEFDRNSTYQVFETKLNSVDGKPLVI